MSAFFVDLTRRHFVRTRGPVTAILTWTVESDPYRTQRPCIALVRTGEEYSPLTQPCVIPLDTAFMWDPASAADVPGAPQKAARATAGFVKLLRLTEDMRTNIWLHSFIHDLLDDLLTMPVAPPLDDEETFAEVTMTVNGQTIEAELKH